MATVDRPQGFSPTAKDLAGVLVTNARRKAARTLREFAEQEIIVPDGEFEGQPFRISRQPYVGLLYDEIDSGQWSEFTITGPSQSGKTLCAFIVPTIYHLMELRDKSIVGLPDAEMSSDKWSIDIKPVMERSGFSHLLPTTGGGSRGGSKVTSVNFINGVVLRFMTGGGGDKSRAGFTARVLLITETDGMDEAGEASREADKISQLQARQRSWPRRRRRTYKECTVSTEAGRTWRDYTLNSTCSKIMTPCIHCAVHVMVEREHLIGWQDAKTMGEAMRNATFVCPNCAEPITPHQQRVMNENAVLVHGDQTVNAAGQVEGPMPDTDHLGFRWSAFNNLFLTAADHAADEWRAAQFAPNTEARINAEKELRQFIWCIPADSDQEELVELKVPELMLRTGRQRIVRPGITQPDQANAEHWIGEVGRGYRRGVIPSHHEFLTIGADIRSTQLHYVVKSADGLANTHVVQYGILKVHSRRLGLERGIKRALEYLRDNVIAPGWTVEGEAETRLPDLVFVDAGWKPEPVYEFSNDCEALDWHGSDGLAVFWPIVGRGDGKQYERAYTHPAALSGDVKMIGPALHVRVNHNFARLYLILDACNHKSWTHARWATPLCPINQAEEGEPVFAYTDGGGTIHVPDEGDHQYFFKQITAEKEIEEFEEGKGTIRRWIVTSRVNHYLDADAYSNAALRWLGVEPTVTAVQDVPTEPTAPPSSPLGGVITPGTNRPFTI